MTEETDPSGRLEQVTVRTADRKTVSRSYTRFVKSMRVLLPLAAVMMTAVLILWSETDERIVPPAKEDVLPDAASVQNELLKPRFESVDDKQQPFTITADKAVQGQNDPDMVRLDRPVADMMMKSGAWVAAEALGGIYEQQTEKLFLSGQVKLFHDSGYQLETDELRIDLKSREAHSDKDVHAQGPAGTLEASGLQAQADEGLLVFKGPARLVLYTDQGGLAPEGILPR